MSVCRTIHILALCGLPLAAAVSAQPRGADEFVSSFRWVRASPGLIFGLAAFFSLVIGLLVFYQWNVRRKAAKNAREHSQELFDGQCRKRRFTEEEKDTLTAMLSYLPENVKPHEIFESVWVFEHCVDAYVNRRITEIRTRERMEDEGEVLRYVRKKMDYDVLPTEQPLASTRNISVGQPTSVIAAGQHAVLAQNTKVTGVGEFYFTIRPDDELKGRSYAELSELTVAFVRNGDAAYSVNAKVMGVNDMGGIMLYHTLKFLRSQHRRYMRLEVNTAMKFTVLDRVGKRDGEKAPAERVRAGRVLDISGGGLSFFADDDDERLEAGDMVLITLTLPGEPLNAIKSKVVHVTMVEGKTAIRYRNHVRYEDIDEAQRERIVKFVFDKHRQMLQMR